MNSKNVPLIDLNYQHKDIRQEMLSAIEAVIDSNAFILGKYVKELEEDFTKLLDCKYALGVNSGTDALFLSLKAVGIGEGDEVINPAYTFVATADVIVRAGAKPVFVDIDPNTYNIDINKLEEAITEKTKAIIPVHLYGLSADMEAIMKLAEKHNLAVIEDCAQSILAKNNGKYCGTIGTSGCFSFYPTKNLGCLGDGGLLTTNDDKVAEMILKYRDHGKHAGYYFDVIGYNSRLAAIQAAVLSVKLKKLKEWTDERIANAKIYDELFKNSAIKTPADIGDESHVYNLYTIQVEKRDELRDYLISKGIGCATYYPLGNHLQKCFDYLGHKEGDFPVCEEVSKSVVSIPVTPGLKKEDVEYVANTVLEFYK